MGDLNNDNSWDDFSDDELDNIREQLKFAVSLGDVLKDTNIDWSKEISFDSLWEDYKDDFDIDEE